MPDRFSYHAGPVAIAQKLAHNVVKCPVLCVYLNDAFEGALIPYAADFFNDV